jgi:predicted protein tyrosine phosphatase
MDSKFFNWSKIFDIFEKEYQKSDIRLWRDFLRSKDLGIICIDFFNDRYIVTDEKKWTLTKIKYGL